MAQPRFGLIAELLRSARPCRTAKSTPRAVSVERSRPNQTAALGILSHPGLRIGRDPGRRAYPGGASGREICPDCSDPLHRVAGRGVATRAGSHVALAELVAQVTSGERYPMSQDIAIGRDAEVEIAIAHNR